MHRDDKLGVASHNYYVQLNKLLGRPGRGMPPGFEQLDEYWQHLRSWLNDELRGHIGICTAGPIGRWSHIGYPISQCLLRKADREKLPDFFKYARLTPGAQVDGQDLIRSLIQWCGETSCRFPERIRQMIRNGSEEIVKQIATIVAEEAAHWDGEFPDRTDRAMC